ncbi:MAG: Tyrosine recombinase XerC [Candidatus Woesebacteria bacterium GW2011_GWB1_40_101]|uniref:Tyrosine recombinase XerC n=2 Tax=Candidatus Woeseibacteriota TaxID=1752722 RepID=A0A0G0TNS0_9BACT|nr:MAG: Tyrosine recombinase XerC [Candidatus Woesebacteria bacterium GW2011_GWB1_40_101]
MPRSQLTMTQDTLKNLLPKFIDYLRIKNRSNSTVIAYRADLEQLINFLQSKSKVLPQQITSVDIEIFRDTLLAEKYTPKSVSRKLNAVKTFFRWLVLEKIVAQDISHQVSHPKIEVGAPKFLSPLEYRALRDVVRSDVRIATIVELILQAGMRISEVAQLKVEDIKNDSIKVAAYATQPERTIPLNKPAKDALNVYLVNRKNESPYVFVSKNGNPLAVRNIRAAVDRYMQKAGIPNYSVNDLRTTFIIENLKAGVDLILLSQVVGHKRLSTTEKYLTLAAVTQPGKRQTLQEL